MRDKWQIIFRRDGQDLHKEFDIHLVPRVKDRVIIPNIPYGIAEVRDVEWDYIKKIVKIII